MIETLGLNGLRTWVANVRNLKLNIFLRNYLNTFAVKVAYILSGTVNRTLSKSSYGAFIRADGRFYPVGEDLL